MKNIVLLVVFIVTVSFIYQTNKSKLPITSVENILEIQLEVAASSHAILLINKQGVINYEAYFCDQILVVDSAKITKQQFNNLADLIITSNFWRLKKDYFDSDLHDGTTYTISVKSALPNGTYSYSVSCYGDCPQKFDEITHKIKALWGKEILEMGM